MLKSISIKNYVLIDELEVDFSGQFSIITGETGAGKSILLGALGLIAGQRADVSALSDKEKKCIIEATFNVKNYALEEFFHQNDLDFQPDCIIRREINPNGKSRCFINDTPVNLSELKSLTAFLIDIHSQHQTLEINREETQIDYLDHLAGQMDLLKQYRQKFQSNNSSKQRLKQLKEEQERLAREHDYVLFQLNEIADFAPKENEYLTLKSEAELLSNAELISQQLSKAVFHIEESEHSIVTQLTEIRTGIQGISRLVPEFNDWHSRLNSAQIDLKEMGREIESYLSEVNFDANRIDWLNQRIASYEQLFRKHQVENDAELVAKQEELSKLIFKSDELESSISELDKTIQKEYNEVVSTAAELHKGREKASKELVKQVKEMLGEMGMPNAELKVELNRIEQASSNGMSALRLLFSANKGSELNDLSKVASGGELSRLMLCIKSVIGRAKSLPTILFDEIDTGISGEIAAKMAAIMKNMAKDMQVIAITHLPQMAGKGDEHWMVYKTEDKNRTITRIKLLNDNDRVNELAKMLSAGNPGQAAISNAKELLGMSAG
jgi:DNA repair protein RecN (Recombination protein N)